MEAYRRRPAAGPDPRAAPKLLIVPATVGGVAGIVGPIICPSC